MKQVFRFNKYGFFVEPILIDDGEEIPVDCTEVPLPQPSWKPRWNGKEWEETITQEELDKMYKPQPPLPSTKERLEALENAMIDIICGRNR